jgi:hypothetical protein
MFTTETQSHGEGKTTKARLEIAEAAETTETNRPCPAVDPPPGAVFAKIEEQIERTIHLIGLIPDADWTPPIPGAWSFAELLGHLLGLIIPAVAQRRDL